MATPADFITATADLSHAAPHQWGAFITQLRAYADAQRDACVRCPLDVLPTMQGRAQGVAELVKELTGAPTAADRMRRNR